ncbi:hypothetical protein NW761_003455 [Fusarium oxysporum]|nr:hypothetical protein NW758_001366 [Fusarium oxysporum]KAJ4100470.1 hypothetical protein NW761_003455 [Fusarium oxysporum]
MLDREMRCQQLQSYQRLLPSVLAIRIGIAPLLADQPSQRIAVLSRFGLRTWQCRSSLGHVTHLLIDQVKLLSFKQSIICFLIVLHAFCERSGHVRRNTNVQRSSAYQCV